MEQEKIPQDGARASNFALSCPYCGNTLLTLGESMKLFFADRGRPLIIEDTLNSAVNAVRNAVRPNGHDKPSPKFKDAAEKWVKSQEPFVSEPTYKRMRHHLNPLNRFFGAKSLLTCADPDLIREYQTKRIKEDGTGGDCINKEISVLKRTLGEAGLWEAIEDRYKPLPVKASLVGRPLSEEVEERLFSAAEANPEWKIANLVALALANTVMSPSEIFYRHIRDIDLRNRWIEIPTGKNKHRVRRIPLDNADALKAITGLLKLAKEKGAVKPEHFLIPYRVQTGLYDPTRHARDCRTAWRKLVKSIGEPRLRMKDLKHHDVTVLDEKGVSRGIINKLAGWSPSSRRADTYSHIRMKPLREAVKLLQRKKA